MNVSILIAIANRFLGKDRLKDSSESEQINIKNTRQDNPDYTIANALDTSSLCESPSDLSASHDRPLGLRASCDLPQGSNATSEQPQQKETTAFSACPSGDVGSVFSSRPPEKMEKETIHYRPIRLFIKQWTDEIIFCQLRPVEHLMSEFTGFMVAPGPRKRIGVAELFANMTSTEWAKADWSKDLEEVAHGKKDSIALTCVCFKDSEGAKIEFIERENYDDNLYLVYLTPRCVDSPKSFDENTGKDTSVENTEEKVSSGEEVSGEGVEENSPRGIVVFPKTIPVAKEKPNSAGEISEMAGKKIPFANISREKIQEVKGELIRKYPWLVSLTECAFTKMEVFEKLDVQEKLCIPVFFDPILVLGPPGVGKTAWASDFGKLVGIPEIFIPMAGKSTAIGFKSGEFEYRNSKPSPVLQTIARAKKANPLVLLDEIDKVGTGGEHGNVQDVALHFLDPTTNSSIYDEFLRVDVNMSAVLWICTANDERSIIEPLLDRMRIVRVDYPSIDHVPVILDTIMEKISRGLPVNLRAVVSGQDAVEEKLFETVRHGISYKKSLRSIQGDVERIVHETILQRALFFSEESREIGFRSR